MDKPGPHAGAGQGEARQYARAHDDIPVFYEAADSAQQDQACAWENIFEDLETKSEDNPRLYELLFEINQKLNMLLNHISRQSGFSLPQAKQVDISGGGLKFVCSERLSPGDRLTLKAFLPVQSQVLRIKCKVIRVSPLDGGGYEVAVEYLEMDEATREKIIKYVFARQRKLLRTEKP